MKRGLLITLVFISSLLISILLLQLTFLSTILLSGTFGLLIIIPAVLSISILTYFSLSSFNTKNITNLILMMIISILAIIPTFPIDTGLRSLLSSLNQAVSAFGVNIQIASLTSILSASALISVWTFAILVIITYNIIPIIGLFTRKTNPQK